MIILRMLSSIWLFRSFIYGSIKREFQAKYRGTQFGAFWIVAQPIALIFVYTVLFAEIMKPALSGHQSRFAFGIYLCAGILPWGLFSETLTRNVNIFVDNANLLKKLSFPKLCLPVVVGMSASIHFAIIVAVLFAFLAISGSFPGWILLAGIPVLLVQMLLATSLGLLLAVINVFYRDVSHSASVILQFWFWLTPIVYVPNILPAGVKDILEFNPMWPLVQSYQKVLLDHAYPVWDSLLYPMTLALVLALLALFSFRRLQAEMVDEL